MNPLQVAVLHENKEYVIAKVGWLNAGFLEAMHYAKVISWDEVEYLRGQVEKMVPFKFLEVLVCKEAKQFDNFCNVLQEKGYSSVSARLRSALKAKYGLDADITRDVEKVVKEHYRCTTESHPRQRELQLRFAEILQTERGCWQQKINMLQSKLDELQEELYQICKRLHAAVDSNNISQGSNEGASQNPLRQINAYTEAFVETIKELKQQNEKFSAESSRMKTEYEEMKWQIDLLERVKAKQKDELRKTKKELHETKRSLGDLRQEMERKDQEKSQEIADLLSVLEEKGAEIDLLIVEKENLHEQMSSLTSKIDELEDHKQATNQRMENIESRMQDLALSVHSKTPRSTRASTTLLPKPPTPNPCGHSHGKPPTPRSLPPLQKKDCSLREKSKDTVRKTSGSSTTKRNGKKK